MEGISTGGNVVHRINPTTLKSTYFHLKGAKLVRPIVAILIWLHVDANWVTGASLIIAGLAGRALFHGEWWTAILYIGLNGLCDVTDGELAREQARRGERKFYLKEMGNVLDGLTDRFADLFFFWGLMRYTGTFMQSVNCDLFMCLNDWFILALGAHIISSYLRASIEKNGYKLDEKRPLTRGGFHVGVILVCLLMGCIPNSDATVFYWSSLVAICLPTIFNLLKRIVKAIIMYRKLKSN
ncbi:CDP-alcohol phosphatidyltransferase family protein [Patescibacteria group bacterium]